MKKYLILLLCCMLMACSAPTNKQEEVTNETLKTTIQWEDNSQKVEELKRLKLTAYQEKTIGQGFETLEIIEWKYGQSDKEEYLLCSFQVDKKKECMIFYKDAYENVNVAEYDIDDQSQDKKAIENFLKTYFVKTEEKTETTQKETTEKKTFTAKYMPDDGEYYNSGEGGWPNLCMIKVKKNSPHSFKFSIWQLTDENGESCHTMIFKEHVAVFESENSKTAVYKGKNYTLSFQCNYQYSFKFSGFSPALKLGNMYSTAGSEYFGQ